LSFKEISAISEAAKKAFRKISKNKNNTAEIKLYYTSERKIKRQQKNPCLEDSFMPFCKNI
jgi:hypothetical protein